MNAAKIAFSNGVAGNQKSCRFCSQSESSVNVSDGVVDVVLLHSLLEFNSEIHLSNVELPVSRRISSSCNCCGSLSNEFSEFVNWATPFRTRILLILCQRWMVFWSGSDESVVSPQTITDNELVAVWLPMIETAVPEIKERIRNELFECFKFKFYLQSRLPPPGTHQLPWLTTWYSHWLVGLRPYDNGLLHP